MKKHILSCAVVTALASFASIAADQETNHNEKDVVVVTASSHATSVQEAPASVTIITEEDINRLPATDIASVLENVAGIDVIKSSGSEPKIVIRGLHNENVSNDNYTLFLINGRRFSSQETVFRGAMFDLSSIPMNAIDHIEVVRGPMSSLYGSDAIGGVVNIILKEPTDETHVSASLGYSTPDANDGNSTYAPDASGENVTGKVFVRGSILPQTLYYTTAVEVSDEDGWYPEEVGSSFDPQAAQKRKNVNIGLNWLQSTQSTWLFDLGYSKVDREELSASSSTTTATNSKKLISNIGNIQERDWGSIDTNYFFENTKINEAATSRLDAVSYKQNNHTLDAKATIDSIERQKIIAGVQLSYTSLENTRDFLDSDSVSQHAAFAQDEIALGDSTVLTVSGRFTHHDQFGTDFSPRTYLVFNATDNLTLKGGYGEGFKAPTIYQSSREFQTVSCGASPCYLTGNPDLKPQTSKSFEFTAAYASTSWSTQATVFSTKIKNMIERNLSDSIGTATDGTGYSIYQYDNVADVKSQGLELEFEFDVSPSIYVTSNATYTKAIDVEEDSDLAFTPRVAANANINWSPTRALNLATGVHYTGKQENWSDTKLPGYQTVDFSASYQVSDSFSVKTGITNLFDKRLDETDYSYQDTEIGRSYYLTLNYDM